MARKIITLLTDDLDGGDADETVVFALDGIGYTIDLNQQNAAKFRDLVEPFRIAGQRLGRVEVSQAPNNKGTRLRHSPTIQQTRDVNAAIRDWAGENGYSIAERGRIPQNVVDAYHAGRPAPTTQETLNFLASSRSEAQEDVVEEPTLPIQPTPRKRTSPAVKIGDQLASAARTAAARTSNGRAGATKSRAARGGAGR